MGKKELNESGFSKIVQEIEKLGDLVKKYQEKKLHLIENFEKNRVLFRKNKLPKFYFTYSLKKTRKRLKKFDLKIKEVLNKIKNLSEHARKFVIKKEPKIIKKQLSSARFQKKKSKSKKKK